MTFGMPPTMHSRVARDSNVPTRLGRTKAPREHRPTKKGANLESGALAVATGSLTVIAAGARQIIQAKTGISLNGVGLSIAAPAVSAATYFATGGRMSRYAPARVPSRQAPGPQAGFSR